MYLNPDATDAQPRFTFHVETARSGEPVVLVTEHVHERSSETETAPSEMPRGAAKPVALASRYDPARDAARMLETVSIKPTDIVIVLGLGNPVIVEQLLPHLGEKQICLAIDAHFALGRTLCAEYPGMLRYLARPGCHLFAGEELLPSLRSYIEGLPAERLSGLRVIRHPASMRLAPEFYETIEGEIRDIVKSKMSDLLTRFEFEQLWLKNILINSRYLPPAAAGQTHATVAPFAGKLNGVPGLLVSAGPSLRESLSLIAECESKCFILACDTALKPLLKAGIQPHAVITLDAQRHTLFAFQGTARGTAPAKTVLFADLVCNPAVLREIEANVRGIIFSTTAQVNYGADGTLHREVTPGTEHAEVIHGFVGTVQSGGSVATSGFDLLRTLGCDPILIVGQDLAYTGRRIHTVGTHHQERWLPAIDRVRNLETIVETIVRKRKTHPVPAIRRDAGNQVDNGTADDNAATQHAEVLGDYVLNLYRLWFEQSIPSIPNRVVNLTAGGAHLTGAEHPADPRAFVATLPVIAEATNIFDQVTAPRLYDHPQNRDLYRDLQALLIQLTALAKTESETETKTDSTIEKFFESYPYLRPLVRRSAVYLKRNREKLGEDRARQLARRNTLEAFRNLQRGLQPFFS